MFQSTRPRGARQRRRMTVDADIVSIHAPARGATIPAVDHGGRRGFNPRARAGRDYLLSIPSCASMFQSTRPRGARQLRGYMLHWQTRFNPRARAGRDKIPVGSVTVFMVSIHAPARGATAAGPPAARPAAFQSTRPRGARPSATRADCRPAGFNPRARAGRDIGQRIRSTLMLFQSTRPRGARPAAASADPSRLVFQSTRPRGARPGLLHPARECTSVSIHAPARGATRSARGQKWAFCFNPRARAGRDQPNQRNVHRVLVSIHAPARGATS